MQGPLFLNIVGESYVFWGDAQKWLEERGYRVLRYTGPGPEVPLTISASTSMPTSSVNDAIMQGGTPEPDSTLPPAATTEGTIAADLMPAPQGGVCHQRQASKSSSREIIKAGWMTPTAPGQLSPLLGMAVHHSEASPQLPSTCPNSTPCLGRQRWKLGCIPSLGIAIRWLALMIRWKSS